jgi:hypothetical protein
MPKMWPRKLPVDILSNPLRNTECRVFDKLKSELGPEYTVFYSRPWHGLTRLGEEIDGECDFLVAHPQHGILCIEVKGGRIRYNPETEKWTSVDRYDITHVIKNPVMQASNSKYYLLKKLEKHDKWPSFRIHIIHGVIFPNCEIPKGDLGADGPREIFCDRNQFENNFKMWIKQRLLSGINDNIKPPGAYVMQALEDILAKPFHLQRPLAYDIDDNEKELLTLTSNQFIILNAIQNIPRVAISGGAGTGKTVLATEEAIRCAKNGLSTLFVCFNSPLCRKVRLDMCSWPEIQVKTFHSICGYLARQSGQKLVRTGNEDFYDEILPEALMRGAELLPHIRYDAIIVDEGQDFRELWWPALDSLLKNAESRLRIFWDSNQAVYGSPSLPENTQSIDIPLEKNLRNSRQIFPKISSLYKGPVMLPGGPDGPPVEWLEVSENASSHTDTAVGIIRRLLNSEKVNKNHIFILSDNFIASITEKLSMIIKNINFCQYDTKNFDSIVVDTIKRVKGLESHIVIVICTDSLIKDKKMQYIAFSRATTHLIIIGYKKQLLEIGYHQNV